jgi:hypothetical protein
MSRRKLRALFVLIVGLVALVSLSSHLKASDSEKPDGNLHARFGLIETDLFDAPLTLLAVTGTGVYLVDRELARYASERMQEMPTRPPPRIGPITPVVVRTSAPAPPFRLPTPDHN